MKKFNDISEFENLLKEQLVSHSTPPPADAWGTISSATAPSAGIIGSVTSYFGTTAALVKTGFFVAGICTIAVITYQQSVSSTKLETTQSDTKTQDSLRITGVNKITDSAKASTAAQDILEPSIQNNASKTASDKQNRVAQSASTAANSIVANAADGMQSNTQITSPGLSSTSPSASKVLAVSASDYNPCLGETVKLTATENGDWYINDKKVAENTNFYYAQCRDIGTKTYIFKTENKTLQTALKVASFNATILKSQDKEGQYAFQLDNKNLIANWFVNEKLYSTNANSIRVTLEKVGKHDIKALVVNNACATPLHSIIKIDPIGSFEAINIFTVDNDGLNDTYKVLITGHENFSMQIFNASSNLVFSTLDPENGWNGSVNNEGVVCPQGEYFARVSYKLQGESPQIKNIKLTLLRP